MRKRFVLTSAQNNTPVDPVVWKNINWLAEHYGAPLLVGTFTYMRTSLTDRDAKRGSEEDDTDVWWDPSVVPHIVDTPTELAYGLRWCGDLQILPTAVNPLSGMDDYAGSDSCIFPHAKMAMRSVATTAERRTKLLYTSGTVTGPNYIQKKAGLKATFHHALGGLLVEVDDDGDWFVRQLRAGEHGEIHDLQNVFGDPEGMPRRNPRAIVWGDIHVARLEKDMFKACWGRDGMLDELQPDVQVYHDLFDGISCSTHARKQGNWHELFRTKMGDVPDVREEVWRTAEFLSQTARKNLTSVVVRSNHDNMLEEWLRIADVRQETPSNAITWLQLNLLMLRAMYDGRDKPHMLPAAMFEIAPRDEAWSDVRWLENDEPFVVDGVELGMHSHLGPNGARGSMQNLSRVAPKTIIGHSHTAGIKDGCYQVGVAAPLRHGYNTGPSSWTHSHALLYPGGKRTIITMVRKPDGSLRWRA